MYTSSALVCNLAYLGSQRLHTPTRARTQFEARTHARAPARSAVTLLTAALPVGLKQSGHRIAFSPSLPAISPPFSPLPLSPSLSLSLRRAQTHLGALRNTLTHMHARTHTHARSLARCLFIKLHCQICQAPNFRDKRVCRVRARMDESSPRLPRCGVGRERRGGAVCSVHVVFSLLSNCFVTWNKAQ